MALDSIKEAVVDLLSARLEALGGAWAYPFVGVAIDVARDPPADKALVAIWQDCCSAAKEMQIHPIMQQLVLKQLAIHIGCRKLLRYDLDLVQHLDADCCAHLSAVFDAVLKRDLDDDKTIAKALHLVHIVAEMLPKGVLQHSSLLRRLLSLRICHGSLGTLMRRNLLAVLPPQDVLVDLVELADLQRALLLKAAPISFAPLGRYLILGNRYPEQLDCDRDRLACVVGVFLSPSVLLSDLNAMADELRSLGKRLDISAGQGIHDWWEWFLIHDFSSSSEIAAFALVSETIFSKRARDRTWMENRPSWLHSVAKLACADEAGQLILVLTRIMHLNAELRTPIDMIWPDFRNLAIMRTCLLKFEEKLNVLQCMSKDWAVRRLCWKHVASISCSAKELALSLATLEPFVELNPLWIRQTGLWSFPLAAISQQDQPFSECRTALLRLAGCIPRERYLEGYYDEYFRLWRHQVLHCHYLYPLLELLVDLEAAMEFDATVPSWLDVRPQWGRHLRSSRSLSAFAQCLLDLQQHLADDWLPNRTDWQKSVMDLAISDEPGRVAILKRHVARMLAAVKHSSWSSASRQSFDIADDTESGLLPRLSSCRTAYQVASLVLIAAEWIVLPSNRAFSDDWLRAMDQASTSFLLSACLISLDTQLPHSLFDIDPKQRATWRAGFASVRSWHSANVPVRCARNMLLALEDHLEASIMQPRWLSDRDLWRQDVACQSDDQGLRIALPVLRKAFQVPLPNYETERKSIQQVIAEIDEVLPSSIFNPNWNRIQSLFRISLQPMVSATATLAICLQCLAQNIIQEDIYLDGVVGDYPSSIPQIVGGLKSIQNVVDIANWNPIWNQHCSVWSAALVNSLQPSSVAMRLLSLMRFMASAPPSSSCHLSYYFRHLNEAWEHSILSSVVNELIVVETGLRRPPLSRRDVELSTRRRIDLSVDELLPVGIYRVLDKEHADIGSAASFADLGMGFGSAIFQVFVQEGGPRKCIGVEIAESRFAHAVETIQNHKQFEILLASIESTVLAAPDQRVLDLRCGDLFDCDDGIECDVVLLHVALLPGMHRRLCHFVHRMRSGCRLITNLNIVTLYEKLSLGRAPFMQLPINQCSFDQFLTTSSPASGQHLFIFTRV